MKFQWDENGPVLTTSDGQIVPLTVINDVPFYVQDKEFHTLPVTPKTDQECMDDYEQTKVTDKIEKEEHSLISDSFNGYVHECLHMFGGSYTTKCNICKIAKQRRHRASAVKEDNKQYGNPSSKGGVQPGQS